MGRESGGRMVFRGVRGRDGGTVSPLDIPQGLMAEVFNMQLDGSGLGAKRSGNTVVTPVNSFPGGSAPDIYLAHARANRGDVVLYGIDWDGGTNTVARLPISTLTWSSAFTLSDNPGGVQTEACGLAFDDQFFLAHNTAVDRLHVIDGDTTVLRRAGLAPPASAPGAGDQGAGAYATVPRWYQQSFRNISGSKVLAESERSPSTVTITPGGAAASIRVTKAATPAGETVTHWVIWASETGASGPFYELVQVAIGTSTYDDSADPATYDNGTAAQEAGTFTVPTSARFLINDGENRILMAGAYEGIYHSRVWFTPAQGSLGRGDNERVIQQTTATGIRHWIDIEEDNGGKITGLGGPLNGQPIVFKDSQIWRLVATSDIDRPYRPVPITRSVGCINHRTIKMGVDESGAACIYFAAIDGPYRLGANGLQYLGRDIEDLWRNRTDAGAFGEFYPKRGEYWLEFSTVADHELVRFKVELGVPDGGGRIRGGWVRDDAHSTTVTRFLVPAASSSTASASLYTQNTSSIYISDNGTQDFGGSYRGYVQTPPQAPAGLGTRFTVGPPMAIGKAASGTTASINVSQRKNYNDSNRNSTALFTDVRTHIVLHEGGGTLDCDVIDFQFGDASSSTSFWTLDAVVVPWEPGEDVVGM